MPTINKKTVTVTCNGTTYTLTPDSIGWDYPQTDGEGSGATDENVMIREVLPERDKITLYYNKAMRETEIRTVLAVRSLESCSVNFYDLRAGSRLTKTMYPSSDEISADMLLADGTNGAEEFVIKPFTLRFIQMIPN